MLLTIAIRVILALVLLFLSTKVLTKRSLSKLTYFDYLAIATLGTLAGNLMFNLHIKIMNFILSISFVTVTIYLLSYVAIKSPSWRKYLAGEATILIRNGKILESNMAKLHYSYDYLVKQLRQEHVFDMSHVEFAMLETNGELSVQVKSQHRPLTPADLQLLTKYEGLATELILDGKLVEEKLKANHLSVDWLNDKLQARGIEDVTEVAFAAISTDGNLYIDLYQD